MSCLNCFSVQDKLTPKQQNYEYTLTRGFPTVGTKEVFDGNLYSNMFKVSESILLTGVSFFGPADVEKATYLVYIQIREMSKDRMKKFVVKDFWDTADASKGHLFRVNFTYPVLLMKKVTYDIRFQLKGPETEYCSDLNKSTFVGTYRDIVSFDFSARDDPYAEVPMVVRIYIKDGLQNHYR